MGSRKRTSVCLIGLLISLTLAGGLLIARQRVLSRAKGTFYTPLDGEAAWEGDWALSELGADPSRAGSTTGTDRVTIPFTGTQLALRVRRGAYHAYFWISVDGEPANRLPHTERGAYLVLSSPTYASEPQVETIIVASGLDLGPHVAVITADRGWDQWPLVGWRVSHTPDVTPYNRALIGLAAVAVLCLVGLVWRKSGGAGVRERREGVGDPHHVLRLTQYALHNAFPGSRLLPPVFLTVAVIFYFSSSPALTLIGLLVLAVLVLLRLDLGLALVALSAPFYRHPRLILGKSFSMAEIAVLLCLASWAVRQVANCKSPFSILHSLFSSLQPPISSLKFLTAIDWAALCFVLVAAASTLLAADFRHVALRELRVVIVEPVLFYLMLRTVQLDEKAVWRVVDAFVLGAAAVAVVGLAQYAFDVNIITAEQGFRRLRSVYGSPNNAALYLGRALPVLVAMALFGRGRRRVLYGAAAAPVAVALLLTFSRGAILLGVPLSLLALGLLAGGRWRWGSLGVVVLAAVSLVPLMRTPRFAGMLDPHNGTLFFRLQLWRAAWMMFRDHAWLGVGPDNFLYHYRGRYILPAAWQEPHLSHAHNVALDYATRLGLAGLTVGVWLQIAFWRLTLPLRDLDDPGRRALALGLMGSMVNFLAHGLVDASYFFPDLALIFFLTLGLVQWAEARNVKQSAVGAKAQEEGRMKANININTVILVLILLSLVGGGVIIYSSIRGVTQPLQQAQQTFQEQLEQLTNPTVTIEPDPVTIVREVRSLSRLETASFTIEKIITAESNQGPFGFLFGDRLILVAHGQVIAGVDLGEMDEGDVAVAGDGTVDVTLPRAEIFVTNLDNEQSYVFHRDTGVIGMNVDLETEARQAAEAEIQKAALEDGILDMAQRNAENYVRHLILTLDFKKVDIAVSD